MIFRLLLTLKKQVATASWTSILIATALHVALSWLLLVLTEPALAGRDFLYFYVVTASTVGYGDLSPATEAGRIVVALVMIPTAIVLFTAVISRLVGSVSRFWRMEMEGKATFRELTGHTVLIGWNGDRTRRLIEQIGPGVEDIVLVACSIEHNPEPDRLHFVRALALTDADALRRAAVDRAARMLIATGDDGRTLAAALAAIGLNRDAHTVAYFEDSSTAALLKTHFPFAEAVVSVSIGIMARALRDPGSSQLARDMNTTQGLATQYSVRVPEGAPTMPFEAVFTGFRRLYDATAIAFTDPQTPDEIDLNPPLDATVSPGDRIYYIARTRLPAVDWGRLAR